MFNLKVGILSMLVALTPSMSMSDTVDLKSAIVGEVWTLTVNLDHSTKDHFKSVLEKVMVDTEENCKIGIAKGVEEKVERALSHAWLTEDGYNQIDGDGYYIYTFSCERHDIYGLIEDTK